MDVHARCLFLLLLWTLSTDGTSAEPCAVFEFPNVTNSILTAHVNSTIDLPFTIKPGPNCHLSNEVTIRVRMREGDKYGDFCSIRQSLGSCHIPLQENGCGCRSGRNLYRLKKTADRIDSTQWLFTTDDGMVHDKELAFNILYPATIESLKLSHKGQSQLVEPGSSVDVACHWQNGNPPTTPAHLVGKNGTVLEGFYGRQNSVHYKFQSVGCQDAGLIRCEVPGASHNKTATLLVKCPPKFPEQDGRDREVGPGHTELNFPVRTYTSDISRCRLTRMASDEADTTDSPPTTSVRQSDCKLTGTPPDLTLTVRLDNVRKEEEGQWRLELTNDAGTGHVDFHLNLDTGGWKGVKTTPADDVFTDDPQMSQADTFTKTAPVTLLSERGTSDNDGNASVGGLVIGLVVIGGFLLIVVVAVVVVFVCKKKGQQPTEIQPASPFPGRALPEVPGCSASSGGQRAPRTYRESLDAHDYVDINDLAADMIPKDVAGAENDGYLSPALPLGQAGEQRSGTYERPPAAPDYTTPNAAYEPLRHLYESFRQWRRSKRVSQTLEEEG